MSLRFNQSLLALSALACALALSSAGCTRSKARGNNANNANGNAAQTTPTVVDITAAAAFERNLPQFFEATGSLAADLQTEVAPAVGGKVVAVYADLGGFVRQGQTIAQLDDRDARIRLQQAEAQVGQLQAQVRQAEVRLGMRPGQRTVSIDDLADPRAIKVQLDLADKELGRYARLLESNDVSRSAYDQKRAQRDQLRQQYDSVRAASAQTYQAVITARAAVDTAETQVTQARKAIADAVIVAPIGGYVAERQADPGEYVSTASKIITIVRTNPVRMRIDIPEQYLSDVRVGQSVSLAVSDFPDRRFSGTIVRLSPNVTATSRTLVAEAEIQNSNNELKPGQFATVRVLLPKSVPAVFVPQRAVRTEGNTSRVFVIQNGRAQERIVQLGQTENDTVEIRSGVAASENVAVSNVELLKDGIEVRN